MLIAHSQLVWLPTFADIIDHVYFLMLKVAAVSDMRSISVQLSSP